MNTSDENENNVTPMNNTKLHAMPDTIQAESATQMEAIPIYGRDTFATDFRNTSNGPEALINGVWYSVNGTREQIFDVRFAIRP